MNAAEKHKAPSRKAPTGKDSPTDDRGRRLEAYRPALEALARRRMNRQLLARVSPADIVQETMFEAFRDWDAYRGSCDAEFHGWLRRILINNLSRAHDRHIKTKKRDARRDISYCTSSAATSSRAALLGDSLRSPVDSPSTIVQRRESVETLYSLLGKLNEDQRRIIELRHFDGLRFKEIGARMNRTESAAKMLWMRTLTKLRNNSTEGQEKTFG